MTRNLQTSPAALPTLEPQRAASPASTSPPAPAATKWARPYLSVRWKFAFALFAGVVWMAFSIYAADAWVHDLARVISPWAAYPVIYGIAVVPGFMNAFLVVSLLLDRRPAARHSSARLPGITILVAAYNEEESIVSTIESIARQEYEGPLQVVVINDGSKDSTAEKLAGLNYPWLQVLNLEHNVGKANALNAGLALVRHHLTITVDGDSYLHHSALHNLVRRYMSDPPNTRAVAGAVLVRNSRKNMVTAIQEWDYFHGIAAIKRLQSLYQGTLVAQGAFSVYDTAILRELGGWAHTVGEDIVLTWAILERGHRVGFAENACLFTNAPDTWLQFIRQRQRWSRGLIEAFKSHWRLLFKPRMTTLFIWWNLLFPYMDLVYTFAFVPGLVLALFGVYWIAGPMTLLVLPLAMIVNYLMFTVQAKMFTEQGLKVRRNVLGFIFYALFYSVVLQPACVLGYIKELVSRSKNWGTK
ncbi:MULTISPECIES: glycosyltransferase family 2 protein [unclassified Acidovorax]|uniref:glycosyltransferase n=1 Tax=unclassified Acidovorax TaxID=2684926 RepID=UPI001C48CE90|nr:MULTISPECIES: glycosyltransferase [unclassified Acidovorax]MBV7427384.1 glycosyltransferase family 2 protein [Acidovorax sp. sif0732]MBV7449744.1 glycosyltransferase family 2 protein [Acidovorax sp. sif0715]